MSHTQGTCPARAISKLNFRPVYNRPRRVTPIAHPSIMEISTGTGERVLVRTSDGQSGLSAGYDTTPEFRGGCLYVAAAASFMRCSELAFRTLWNREGREAAYRLLEAEWSLPRRRHPGGVRSPALTEARQIGRDIIVVYTIMHPSDLAGFEAGSIQISTPTAAPYTVVACAESDRR
jgi:hypothetical protein